MNRQRPPEMTYKEAFEMNGYYSPKWWVRLNKYVLWPLNVIGFILGYGDCACGASWMWVSYSSSAFTEERGRGWRPVIIVCNVCARHRRPV